jgi:hypothetical protein
MITHTGNILDITLNPGEEKFIMAKVSYSGFIFAYCDSFRF